MRLRGRKPCVFFPSSKPLLFGRLWGTGLSSGYSWSDLLSSERTGHPRPSRHQQAWLYLLQESSFPAAFLRGSALRGQAPPLPQLHHQGSGPLCGSQVPPLLRNSQQEAGAGEGSLGLPSSALPSTHTAHSGLKGPTPQSAASQLSQRGHMQSSPHGDPAVACSAPLASPPPRSAEAAGSGASTIANENLSGPAAVPTVVTLFLVPLKWLWSSGCQLGMILLPRACSYGNVWRHWAVTPGKGGGVLMASRE